MEDVRLRKGVGFLEQESLERGLSSPNGGDGWGLDMWAQKGGLVPGLEKLKGMGHRKGLALWKENWRGWDSGGGLAPWNSGASGKGA